METVLCEVSSPNNVIIVSAIVMHIDSNKHTPPFQGGVFKVSLGYPCHGWPANNLNYQKEFAKHANRHTCVGGAVLVCRLFLRLLQQLNMIYKHFLASWHRLCASCLLNHNRQVKFLPATWQNTPEEKLNQSIRDDINTYDTITWPLQFLQGGKTMDC